jgi:hypothetical protein
VSTFNHRGAGNPRTAGAANRRTANSSVEGGGLLVRGPQSGSGEQLSPPLQGNGCGNPKNRRSSTPKNCTSGARTGGTGLAGAYQGPDNLRTGESGSDLDSSRDYEPSGSFEVWRNEVLADRVSKRICYRRRENIRLF